MSKLDEQLVVRMDSQMRGWIKACAEAGEISEGMVVRCVISYAEASGFLRPNKFAQKNRKRDHNNQENGA